MAPEASRRKKSPRRYSVVIVPSEEGGKTRSIVLGRLTLWMVACGVFFGIVALTLGVLYTPVGSYVHIPNPELERKYGTQLRETQERLEALAEDVLLLRDYNHQLRKALGERDPGDTTRAGRHAPSLMTSLEGKIPKVDSLAVQHATAVPATDTHAVADYDLMSSYNAVVTNTEGFRAAFPLLLPTEGYVSQDFDPSRRHYGMDFAAKHGTPVYAASDGYIIFAGWTYDSGNMIMISHGGGYLTIYKHSQSLLKNEYSFVRRGELISLVGNTGTTSSGPHLHFELWKDGLPLDPKEFLLTPPILQ